jgi:hypothetical protein
MRSNPRNNGGTIRNVGTTMPIVRVRPGAARLSSTELDRPPVPETSTCG